MAEETAKAAETAKEAETVTKAEETAKEAAETVTKEAEEMTKENAAVAGDAEGEASAVSGTPSPSFPQEGSFVGGRCGLRSKPKRPKRLVCVSTFESGDPAAPE